MRASRGMGDIKPSKMPGKKIIQRKDDPQDVEVYARGGRIGGNVTVSKAGTPSAVVRKLLAKPGSLKASDLFAGGGKAGLYENINKKRARIAAGSGERMRKVGAKGAPTKADFIKSAKTAKKK
jgi:hypothetical protein